MNNKIRRRLVSGLVALAGIMSDGCIEQHINRRDPLGYLFNPECKPLNVPISDPDGIKKIEIYNSHEDLLETHDLSNLGNQTAYTIKTKINVEDYMFNIIVHDEKGNVSEIKGGVY